MTHHTDAERAEFIQWGANDGCTGDEMMAAHIWDNNYSEARAWKAARRAPAVPVPQSIEQMAVDRYKVVPSHESMFHRWAVVAGNGTQQLYIGREAECQNMARKFTGAFLDGAFVALAAAPQPPEATVNHSLTVEAAPVKLPEPSAWMLGCQTIGGDVGWKLSWSKPGAGVCHRLSGKEFEHPLYTEQQVRQLLEAHGIEVAQ